MRKRKSSKAAEKENAAEKERVLAKQAQRFKAAETNRAKKDSGKALMCPFNGCKFTANRKWNLSQHTAAVHEVNVKWHSCGNCEYRAKDKSNLIKHNRRKHQLDAKGNTILDTTL